MLKARDIMIPEVKFIKENSTIKEAAVYILNEGIGSLIVVDENNAPVGIVTKRDILRAVLFEEADPGKTIVKKIMSKPIIMIDADSPVEIVIDTMMKYNISHLPVVESNKIIGIISDYDIMEFARDLIDILKNKGAE